MKRRPYTGKADLALLQDFNAKAIAVTDHCGYLHPGDIPHHLYGGNRFYDPAEVMTIWEDDRGVAAWLLVGPRHKSYDAQVRPDLRGSAFEREVLETADQRTVELMHRYDIAGDCIYADAFRGDTARNGVTVGSTRAACHKVGADPGKRPAGQPGRGPLRSRRRQARRHDRA